MCKFCISPMKRKKVDVKDLVLPHTQAKLDLYKNYLELYLKVLNLSPYIDEINIYDAFCGSGMYKDGKFGSPIIANESIAKINQEVRRLNKPLKKITLSVNDKEADKIDNVKTLLLSNKQSNCSYYDYNLDANRFLDDIAKDINGFHNKVRSLVFIDPYGYSSITKERIYNIVQKEYSEVLLFLPVMQMYRFKTVALNDFDRTCYEGLRNFIFSFFPAEHKIHYDGIDDVFEFINEIKKALSFEGKFYSCSHYIEREKGNYYALFFVTSNIYGLEKMVEAKWKLDPNQGKGFKQLTNQINMFDDAFIEVDKTLTIERLKGLIRSFITRNNTINNTQLYYLAVANEFLPSQANDAISQLFDKGVIKVVGSNSKPTGNYINYSHYKKNEIKVTFQLR